MKKYLVFLFITLCIFNFSVKSQEITVEAFSKDILNYSFVLKPLMDIAPTLIHPVTKQSIETHWRLMNCCSDELLLIDIELY